MTRTEKQRFWILDWLQSNIEASALNQRFHDDFFSAFGGSRIEKCWGAQPVLKAQRLLAQMAKQGSLEIRRVGLGFAWQPGFPKSVLSYSLPDFLRRS